MSQFRLNAKKPKNNAGLPTPKTELYLLYVEDIISMPEVDAKGILSTSDIVIAPSRRFHILYQTPSSQVHSREIEGDADSRGFKKKLTGSFPGDDLEINEFIKNNLNQGFVILVKSCHSDLKKIYGSKCNPLYFTGSFTDDNEHKGYELTFEQEFADDTPVIFYKGNVLVDEDALGSTAIVRNLPRNIATIDYTDDDGEKQEGNTYTKKQIQQIAVLKPLGPEIYFDEDSIDLSGGQLLYSFDNYRYTAISFEDFMKGVNKNLKVNNNATGDDTYTYEVVAKPDKTLGIVRKRFVDVLKENVSFEVGSGDFNLGLGYHFKIEDSTVLKITDVELIVNSAGMFFTIKPKMVIYIEGILSLYNISDQEKRILSSNSANLNIDLKYKKIVY